MLKRRSIRLQDYDYTQNGAYFVTIGTQNREEIFGNIVDGEMHPDVLGEIVLECWQSIPEHFPHAELDEFVMMPNHLHGIVVIADDADHRRARHGVPLRSERFGKPVSGSLPTIIRSFKTAAASRVNKLRNTPGESIWQRNYYEHVICNEESLNKIRQYIQSNPARWKLDSENPTRRNL